MQRSRGDDFLLANNLHGSAALKRAEGLPEQGFFPGSIMSSIKLAVIPVAGLGTRLLPSTKSQPKEMLPVAKKPVVQYVVEEMEANGIDQILLVTGRNKTSIENHFDFDHELTRRLRETGKEDLLPELEYERMRLQFFFTRQRKQKGLGDAVLCAQKFTKNDPFAVALGDSIIGLQGRSRLLEQMCRVFEEEQPSCIIAVQEVTPDRISSYGIVKPVSDGSVFVISDMVEKPAAGEAPSNLAVSARYIFTPEIYDAINHTYADKGGEVQLTDAIRLLIRDGRKVMGIRLPAGDNRYDIGNFGAYYRAFIEFAMDDPDYGEEVKAFIKEKAGENNKEARLRENRALR